jgi:hypothetical protein
MAFAGGDPCNASGGAIFLTSKPAAPPPPICSISEYERPVVGPFDHTYLYVSDSSADISDILEGGPTPHPSFNPFGGNWGDLYGWISGNYVSNRPQGPLKGDNTATNQNIATLTGGSAVCFDVLELVANVVAYDSGSQPQYLPWPSGGYRNSNSFTYTLLDSIEENNPNWAPGGNVPGWGLIVRNSSGG